MGAKSSIKRVVRACLTWVVSGCNVFFFSGGVADPGGLPALTRVEQIRKLSVEEARRGYPVRLDAVVTYADLDWSILFVQDETGGIYVNPGGNKTPVQPGQRVQVEGISDPGTFRPFVNLTRLVPGKMATLPQSRLRPLSQLMNGAEDCQWGQVEGVVRSATDEDGHLNLTLAANGTQFVAIIMVFSQKNAASLINAQVRIEGVYGSFFNDRREFTGLKMFVPSLANVTILKRSPDDAFAQEVQPVEKLLRLGANELPGRRVRVQGVVVETAGEKRIRLRDRTTTVEVESTGKVDLVPGTLVDAVGFLAKSGEERLLQDAIFRRIGFVATNELTTAFAAPPTNVLATLQQVRELTPLEATKAHPVQVRAVVTYYDLEWGTLFVQDATAGIYVDAGGHPLDLKPGDLIELSGATAPGDYAPIVSKPRVQILGHAALPKPAAVSWPELSSGSKDSQWVEVKGVARSLYVRDGHLYLDIAADGGRFEALLPGFWNEPPPSHLIDAAVSLRGACGAVFNQRRQLVGISLHVPGLNFITTDKAAPSDPFSLPVQALSGLLQFTSKDNLDHRVHVQGVVTFQRRGEYFYIQDETAGLFVKTRQTNVVSPGDAVDVVGFPMLGGFSPVLTEGVSRQIGRRPLPEPATVTAEQARSADWDKEIFDARRVRIRARLLDMVLHGAEKQLVLQDGSQIFSAVAAGEDRSGVIVSLQKGSLLELTGVCSVKADENRNPRSFQIQLQSPGDIRVLQSPSWWTPEHALAVIGVVVLIAVTASGFVVALRRRVRQQTEVIRQRLEREVALEERYRDLVENANDFIYTHDLKGNYTSFNPAGLKLTGYTRDEILKMKSDQLVAPEHRELAWRMFRQKLDHGGVTTYELEYLAKNGRRVTLEVSSRLVYQDGRPIGVQGIARDITGRKRVEVELRKAKEAAEQASRAKSEFLANMSHEIRTPLNGVIGMTNLLQQTKLSREQRDYVETARTSGDLLLTVINDILDFSKIEAGKLQFEALDFNLAEVVEETVELLAQRAQSKGVELGSLIDPAAPRQVRGDPGRLRQIILNLTGNAIKFTERGEVLVEVACVEESADDVLLRFEISDTGVGITPEAQERLFKPFSQADSSTTRKYGGTGLGLVICKQLVERMNGEIGVRSAEGEGSTFWFTVRLEKQPATHEAVEQDDLAHLRVLIVDDHPTQRKVLSHHLHAWRVRNGLICAPQDAVNFLRCAAADGTPYDFVVLNLQQPEHNGVPLARAIKSAPELTGVRLVMLTSLHYKLLPPEIQAAGIDAVLAKPVRPSTLYACFVKVRNAGASTTVHFHRKNNDGAAAPFAVPTSTRVLRILVAEDNAVNQKVAVRQLEKLGYSVVDVAANGFEVIEALKRTEYEVVLMDCQMPELDGYEATRRVRQFSSVDRAASSAAVHIIAMTANAMEGDRELCLAAGMDDYIAKPMRIEELQVALRKVPLDRAANASGVLASCVT